MSTVEELGRDLKTFSKDTDNLIDLWTSLPLYELEKSCSFNLDKFNNRIQLRVKTYENVVKILRLLKRDLNLSLTMTSNFYSEPNMFFVWSYIATAGVSIWFTCPPDDIPKELMPSDKCIVQKTMSEPSVDYAIVCPIDGGDE